MNTVEEIKKILTELRNFRQMLDGPTALLKASDLATWQANLTEEIALLESEVSKELEKTLTENEKMSVSRAKIKIESGDNYRKLNRRKKLNGVITEEIRNLRQYSRIRREELEGTFEPRI